MRTLFWVSLITALLSFYSVAASVEAFKSQSTVYALRLGPGEELFSSIVQVAKNHKISAGYVITCVGSLTQAAIRLANQDDITIYKGHFEITSLVGTVSDISGAHIHITIADEKGIAIGGHLVEGSFIYTTAEIVLGSANALVFERKVDPKTTYEELSIRYKRF